MPGSEGAPDAPVSKHSRVVVLGASGFTGRLVAKALVARGVKPVLAGRSKEKIKALADELGGLETASANATVLKSIQALVGRGDVLVTTVGPFARYGQAALNAAISEGAHYVDSTGEAGFVRSVFEDSGPRAAAADCALLTAFGYDFVPGNLAAALVLRQAGSAATQLDTGYFIDGPAKMSSGTAATAAGGLLDPAHQLSQGRLVLRPMGRTVHTFVDRGGARRAGVLYGSTEALALPHTFPQLTSVSNYLGWFGKGSYALIPVSYATSLLKLPPLRQQIQKRADKIAAVTGKGPSEKLRAGQRSVAIAVASDATGKQLAAVRVEGPNAYDLTGDLMAWAAIELAYGRVTGRGALGPVEAFGIDRLVEGCRSAGLVATP
jgi:short subunit dehydrogenase-like uncharacterized protein